MTIRTGAQVMDRLRNEPPNLWIDGTQVIDPTTHPATRNGVASLAALYDLQSDPVRAQTMTTTSPTSGDQVGMSFIIPRTIDDLVKRSEMHREWANASLGHLGRAPDYLNVNLMAAGTAAPYFDAVRDGYGQNMAAYFEHVRENDLALTHALTHPQVDRTKPVSQLDDPFTALGLVEERSDGIIVRGARMLATLPISDEILIFPSTVIQGGDDMRPYALGFAIANNTPGLVFQCREPLDIGRSRADHPLGSRFDEIDAMVIFDDVFVPAERVFLTDDVQAANQAYARTGAVLHMAHQVVNLKIAKTEAILGTLQAVIDMIGSGGYPHVQEMASEVIIVLEIMKALKVASEQGARLNEYGVMTPARGPLDAARNYFPAVHNRLMEIMQLCCSSGLIMIPTEADRHGPRGEHIAKYLQARGGGADDRLKLFRLAWDMTMSGFGGRQGLYERFFFGDPTRMRQALFGGYDSAEYVKRVQAFLENEDWPQTAS